MSCKIPKEVQAYVDLVESGEHRCCREQKELAAYVKKVFATEDLFVDEEQLHHYLGLAKYFPFKRLFPWQEFVVTLWDCTYKSDGGISYAPETLKNGLPCPRSGHLFSTLFVITGNLNIYKKIRIQ